MRCTGATRPRRPRPVGSLRDYTLRAVVVGSALPGERWRYAASGGPPTTPTQTHRIMFSNALNGQVAFVTGAARGIGRATAVRLAREGADVALLDVAQQIDNVEYDLATADDLEAARSAVEAEGRKALVIQADIRDAEALSDAVARTEAELGPISVLVANAALNLSGSLLDMNMGAFERVLDVNIHGTVNTLRAVLPGMVEREEGRVIVVSSSAGRQGSAGIAGYSTTKWALVGLTKSVALEVGGSGVTVNCVCPTLVHTPLVDNEPTRTWISPDEPTWEAVEKALKQAHPLPVGPLEPEEIANAITFYATPAARYISGAVLDVCAGMNAQWTA